MQLIFNGMSCVFCILLCVLCVMCNAKPHVMLSLQYNYGTHNRHMNKNKTKHCIAYKTSIKCKSQVLYAMQCSSMHNLSSCMQCKEKMYISCNSCKQCNNDIKCVMCSSSSIALHKDCNAGLAIGLAMQCESTCYVFAQRMSFLYLLQCINTYVMYFLCTTIIPCNST